MTANLSVSSFEAARLHSAGMSLRLVKSPLAPKMTITQGSAGRAGGCVCAAAGALVVAEGLAFMQPEICWLLSSSPLPARRPFPPANLGHVLAVCADVTLVVHQFARQLLLEVRRPR